jgi:hypothetical protein
MLIGFVSSKTARHWLLLLLLLLRLLLLGARTRLDKLTPLRRHLPSPRLIRGLVTDNERILSQSVRLAAPYRRLVEQEVVNEALSPLVPPVRSEQRRCWILLRTVLVVLALQDQDRVKLRLCTLRPRCGPTRMKQAHPARISS